MDISFLFIFDLLNISTGERHRGAVWLSLQQLWVRYYGYPYYYGAGRVGTYTCIACHWGWPDNDPPIEDEIFLPVNPDYVPFNLAPSHGQLPFYTIPEGYISSIHYTPSFNPLLRDYVPCENCHGSGLAHFGIGFIPRSIPQADTCGLCHNTPPSNQARLFDLNGVLIDLPCKSEFHPGKIFRQWFNGPWQAQTSFPNLGEIVSLFQSDQLTPVTRNQRSRNAAFAIVMHYNTLDFRRRFGRTICRIRR